jgi:hypothetical protein
MVEYLPCIKYNMNSLTPPRIIKITLRRLCPLVFGHEGFVVASASQINHLQSVVLPVFPYLKYGLIRILNITESDVFSKIISDNIKL